MGGDILPPPLISCVPLGKSFDVSEPQLSRLLKCMIIIPAS